MPGEVKSTAIAERALASLFSRFSGLATVRDISLHCDVNQGAKTKTATEKGGERGAQSDHDSRTYLAWSNSLSGHVFLPCAHALLLDICDGSDSSVGHLIACKGQPCGIILRTEKGAPPARPELTVSVCCILDTP